MYVLVNDDLKMGRGKACSQVGHGVGAVLEELLTGESPIKPSRLQKLQVDYRKWKNSGSRKIVLKATLKDIETLHETYENTETPCRVIVDAGLTQISPNSKTCLAFFPIAHGSLTPLTTYKLY